MYFNALGALHISTVENIQNADHKKLKKKNKSFYAKLYSNPKLGNICRKFRYIT